MPENDVGPEVAPGAALPMAVPDVGAPINEAVSQLANTEERVAINHEEMARQIDARAKATQIKADQIGAMNAVYAMKMADQEDFHGVDGLFNQNPGVDAPKDFEKRMEARELRNAKIRDALPNKAQQDSFDLHAMEQKYQVHGQADEWQHHQLQQADNVAFATSQKVHYNDAMAALASPDPAKRSQGFNQAVAARVVDIQAYGDRNGWSNIKDANGNTKTTLAIEESTNEMAMGAMHTIADSGDTMALKEFHVEHKDDFRGNDIGESEKMVQRSDFQTEAQQLADSMAIKPDGSYITETEKQNLVRNEPRLQKNVRLRDETDKRLSGILKEHRDAVIADQRTSFDAMGSKLLSGTSILDPSIQNHLHEVTPEQQVILERYAKKEIPEPDPADVYKAKLRLADQNTRYEASQEDLTRKGWSPQSAAFKEVSAMQIEIRKSGTFDGADGIQTKAEILSNAVEMEDLKGSKKAILLRNAINARIEATQKLPQNKGKQLSPKEMNDIADDVRVESIMVPGAIYGKNDIKLYEATPEQLKKAVLPIPDVKKLDPIESNGIRQRLQKIASSSGLNIDRITEDQYSQAMAQVLLSRQYKQAGNNRMMMESLNNAEGILAGNQPGLTEAGIPFFFPKF